MNDLLDRYGEQWRAAQPTPPVVVVAALRDRRRWPVVAAVLALAAAAVTGVTVHVGETTSSRPAQLTTGQTESPAALPRHAGTLSDPVPWLDRQPGPADVPVAPDSPDQPSQRSTCPGRLTGSVAFTQVGAAATGLLTLHSPDACTLAPYLDVQLRTADGRVVGHFGTSAGAATTLAPASYPAAHIGPDVAGLARVQQRCPQPATTALIDNLVTVAVTGLRSSDKCDNVEPGQLQVTPIGAGYVPAVAPADRASLRLSLTLPDTEPSGLGFATGLLTIANPTGAAIPLAPCAAVGGTITGRIDNAGQAFNDTIGFALNCAQAPPAVTAHGEVVFAVQIATRTRLLGPAGYSVDIAGSPGAPTASTILTPATPCSPSNLLIGQAVTTGPTTSVRLTARTACTLAGQSLLATPELRTDTGDLTLTAGAVAEVDVQDSTGQGCAHLNEPDFSETVTLDSAVLIAVRLPRAACADYLRSELVAPAPITPTTPAATTSSSKCRASDLYGSVDDEEEATGYTYELALTNTGSSSCQLSGQPLSLQGVRSDGSVVDIAAPRLSGPSQSPHETGSAAPGEPEHLLVYGLNGCNTGTGLTVTTLLIHLADGVVRVPATGVISGLLHLQCNPRLSDFFGPVSVLLGTEPQALPSGPACTAAGLRVTTVTYDHVLAGEDGYNIGVEPPSGSCVLRAADIGVSDVFAARGPQLPTGVVVSSYSPAYIFVGGDSGGLCQVTRSVTDLGVMIAGAAVKVTPPAGEGAFTVCTTDTSVSLSTTRLREAQASHP